MNFEIYNSPVNFLRHMLGDLSLESELRDYDAWWKQEGLPVADAVDRAGTPWLRMFDRFGERSDEIMLSREYWTLLHEGYRRGVIWRAFEEKSLLPSYLLGYLTAFYDAGLYCPYTVSLSTAVPLYKYGSEDLREKFLPQMLRRDNTVWQGATWMTESGGGSDLAASVETRAECKDGGWRLTGEKYFASNAGAELAVVAARPEGAPAGVRGLALFLMPRQRSDGRLNYTIRRIKDKIATRAVPTGEVELCESDAWLLGKMEWGIYQILEVLNISRVANAVGSVALAQRTISQALDFARRRQAFGKAIIEHPLLRRQFEEKLAGLQESMALAWEAVRLLNAVWQEQPPYSERYHLFRLIAHLAKYATAEFAVQCAKWNMEVHGGIGTLAEFPIERSLREAMILSIWEGTPHRQILDGCEVMQRKGAHRLLLQRLASSAAPDELAGWTETIEDFLHRPQAGMEAGAEQLFQAFASFVAKALLQRDTA